MTDFSQHRTTMVDTQVRPSDVTKFPIIEAMLSVPRENFVPADRRAAAYAGEQLSLAPGRAILDPRLMAKMLDAVDIQSEEMVLDVGPGLGYSSALVARMAEAVIAVEEIPELASEAERALSDISADNVAVVEGPLAEGAAVLLPERFRQNKHTECHVQRRKQRSDPERRGDVPAGGQTAQSRTKDEADAKGRANQAEIGRLFLGC